MLRLINKNPGINYNKEEQRDEDKATTDFHSYSGVGADG
jgi:hypothetical protein